MTAEVPPSKGTDCTKRTRNRLQTFDTPRSHLLPPQINRFSRHPDLGRRTENPRSMRRGGRDDFPLELILEERGLRTSVALYCVRPDLIDYATFEEIGEITGRTRQYVHKLANSFRLTLGIAR